MAGFLEIIFDPRNEFREYISNFSHLITTANYAAAAHIRRGLGSIIMNTYYSALAQAGDAFPEIYADHLGSGLARHLQPNVYATQNSVVAEVFDIESLGTYEDFVEGFHYHALENPIQPDGTKFSLTVSVIDLPYTGQEMYNENDWGQRYDFWQHVVSGDPYTVRTKGKGGYEFEISTEGLYEETLRARVENWGDRYPEWILLDTGTPYVPEIPPLHISELIRENCYTYMQEVWQQHFQQLVDAWNSGSLSPSDGDKFINNPGTTYEPKGRGSKKRGPNGRFI